MTSVGLLIATGCAKQATESSKPANTSEHGNAHEPAKVKCAPGGSKLKLSAVDVEFSTDCLAVAANAPFAIEFENDDTGVEHNVAIFKDPKDPNKLFTGELITGPSKVTYQVGAIDKGSYHFHCDVHPEMKGTLVVD